MTRPEQLDRAIKKVDALILDCTLYRHGASKLTSWLATGMLRVLQKMRRDMIEMRSRYGE